MSEDLKHSIEYINNKIHNKHGFSVPSNYFKELEAEISNTFSEINIPEQNNFDTPTDYFSSLEDQILTKVKKESTTTIKVISLKGRLKKYIPKVAAAAIFLFTSIYFILTRFDDSNISAEEVQAWFDNDYDTTSTYELAMLLDNNDLIGEEISLNLNNDDLDEYFNTIDNSSLIDELQ